MIPREEGQLVVISYTNHRGERAGRLIIPERLWFGEVGWHPGRQWLLDVLDVAKGEGRTLALKDIHSWRPAGPVEEGP